MPLMEKHPSYLSRDISQVVVDLDELSKAVSLLEDLVGSIGNRLVELRLSLQDTV